MEKHFNGIEVDKLEEKEFDAGMFYIESIDEKTKQEVWSVSLLQAKEGVVFDEPKRELGYKYTICSVNKKTGVEVFDAILGDPHNYINNCMQAGEAGCIVKKSPWGDKIIELFKIIVGDDEHVPVE